MDPREEIIKDSANAIKARLKIAMIYGVPFDIDNPDHLVCAVYMLGNSDGRAATLQEYDLLINGVKHR